MGYHFEFDAANKVLLIRIEGRLTDELLAECHRVAQRRWVETNAEKGIFDLSSVTELGLTTGFLKQLALEEPVGDPTRFPRVFVAPTTLLFGLSRMFQNLVEATRPMLLVVHTLDEAFPVLGVESPHFERLD